MRRREFLRQSGMKTALWTPIAAVMWSSWARSEEKDKDPWPKEDLLAPNELADELAGGASSVSIFCVGFPVLYRGVHIVGSRLGGPCSKPAGLALLHESVNGLPRGRKIVCYCGCCPFEQCPNIRPGYVALRQMGFTRLKVLHLRTSLHTDWVTKGYPIEKAEAS